MNNDPKNKKPQDNKPQNGDDGRQGRRIIFLMVAALIATLLINSLYTTIANAYLSEITYNEFQTYLDKDEIAELEFQSDRMVILTRDEAKKPSAQQRLYYTGYIPNVSNDDLKDRLDAQGRAADETDDTALHVSPAFAAHLYVDHVARHGHRNEHDDVVPSPERLALGGYGDDFERLDQRMIRFFSSHLFSRFVFYHSN